MEIGGVSLIPCKQLSHFVKIATDTGDRAITLGCSARTTLRLLPFLVVFAPWHEIKNLRSAAKVGLMGKPQAAIQLKMIGLYAKLRIAAYHLN